MNIPLNINVQQILLHMVNFIILFGGLYFLLYSPVKSFMDKRAEKYASEAEESTRRLAHAAQVEKEVTDRLENIDAEIARRRDAAAAEAAEQTEKQLAGARQQADSILQAARLRANREYDKRVSDAREEIAAIAAQTAKRIAETSDSDALDTFLDSAERE